MTEWKDKFEKSTLERGRGFYLNQRVVGLEEIIGGYQAAVLGRRRFEVTVKLDQKGVGRMNCSCPVARGGKTCDHMAAVLYAIEAKEEIEQDRQEENLTEATLMEMWRQLDEEARKAEEAKKEEEVRKKREKQETKRRRQKAAEEAAEKAAQEKAAREEQLRQEEIRRQEEEKAAREIKAAEEARVAEQEKRRLTREARKAERERQKEEQKRQAEEARRKENEKRQAEESRREAIRKQKAEDARRRAEKKQKEQEEAKRLEEKRRKEQEEEKRMEEQRKQEEEKLLEEQRKQEEAKRLGNQNFLRNISSRKEDYTLLGDPWDEDLDGVEEQNSSEIIAKLEQYNYFNGTRIKNSIEIAKKVLTQGRKLCEQKSIRLDRVITGYEQYGGEILGQADGTGKEDGREVPIRVMFFHDGIKYIECKCSNCRRDYYSFYENKVKCPYKAGILLLLEDFLGTHNIGDATDASGEQLIDFYQWKRANHAMAGAAAKKESLNLVPRLTRKEGKLSLSFKIGERKLFVVKKLDDFCRNVKDSATNVYGSNTEINHSLENFTKEGRGWIHFINQIVREEEEFQQRMLQSRSYYNYKKSGVGSELSLFGWRLDEFYHQMGDGTIEFEDKDGSKKKKAVLSCASSNPKVTMRISAENQINDGEFHGIMVKGSLPALFFGTDTAYYIGNHHLNQVDKEFLEKIEPLANLAKGGNFSFVVGRNNMSEFYYTILPQLQDIVKVTETEPEKFRSYLPPKVHFTFYLDAEDQNAFCSISAHYGERECSVLDIAHENEYWEPEIYRDLSKEEEILFYVKQLFPEIDWKKEALHCGGDEDLVYEVMEHGIRKLMEFGEVRCTKAFLGFHAVKSVKVSVGVSVSAGLLELDIATEDVPKEELLDILNSYRLKKKYYRLKDGSFVNLEDSSLEMLAELMNAAHVKPKEFVKGKMHLPMYRTLYLDKMLEENESVYSSRDSHFREVVKGFKTIQDADFEEPESLSQIMRKYQKNGYKWLRTLENWQFGGILADDMGLGKTLQVIAVLLAAKQEGKAGTSLVVSPASLVYNWGEEFEKFAPELNVSLITGTQEERQAKIEAWQEADVLVTSYDLLKRDILYYEEKQFNYEIIDEAQYIKNHTTAAAKAVKIVSSRIRYALTGTPIENRLSELWSIFDYLMPGFLYGYDVFKREIESPVVKSGDETALKRLQKMVGPFVLRRLKEDVLKDLPEKLEECRYVRFSGEQRKLYDGQVVHMRENIARQNAEEFNRNKMLILAELTKLRQICCDPALCFENYKGEAAKLEACADLIQSAMDGGHRMLVFSQFTSMLDILQKKLDSLGISYYTITGSTSKEKRLAMVKEFNEGDVPVFLISLKAGGVGLNLIGADVVIHYDPWWNLAVQNQATDRAHRIGQRKKVTVYKLIAKNTIEEKIQKLQEMKKHLADQVISGETGQLGSLSREEMLELLEV